MRKFFVIVFCSALVGCAERTTKEETKDNERSTTVRFGESASEPNVEKSVSYSSASPTTPAQETLKASISIASGEPRQTVALIPVGDNLKRQQFASLMRESGFDCNSVSSVYQLQQEDSQFLDIWKLDCDTGDFQLTMLNDRVFIKDWTGNLLGR